MKNRWSTSSSTAEIDLGCKDQLGSVEALAGEWQDEYIASARGRLTQIRDAQAPVLAAAEVYLDEHGIAVPPHDPATDWHRQGPTATTEWRRQTRASPDDDQPSRRPASAWRSR